MKNHIAKAIPAMAALTIVAWAAQAAQAIEVRYTTEGVFGSSGSNVFEQDGVLIEYLAAQDDNPYAFVEVPLGVASAAGLGRFQVVDQPVDGTTPVSDSFTLTISQIQPSTGDLIFTATLAGQFVQEASQAYILFDSVGPEWLGLTQWTINANQAAPGTTDPVPGRLNLNPIGTDAGLTSLPGAVLVIPEPSSVVMAGLGLVGVVGLGLRRRRAAR